MTDRPPSPTTPTASTALPSTTADTAGDEPVLITTTQLVRSLEEHLGLGIGVSTTETILLELDRRKYVEWVTITRNGDYVWDVSSTPERIGVAVAAVLVEQLCSWVRPDE